MSALNIAVCYNTSAFDLEYNSFTLTAQVTNPELCLASGSSTPTVPPTTIPTATPTVNPTANPAATPTSNPTANPAANPTANPTVSPTANPTADPTADPTANPSANPSFDPTTTPTLSPTSNPTATPSTHTHTTTSPKAIPNPDDDDAETPLSLSQSSSDDDNWGVPDGVFMAALCCIAILILALFARRRRRDTVSQSTTVSRVEDDGSPALADVNSSPPAAAWGEKDPRERGSPGNHEAVQSKGSAGGAVAQGWLDTAIEMDDYPATTSFSAPPTPTPTPYMEDDELQIVCDRRLQPSAGMAPLTEMENEVSVPGQVEPIVGFTDTQGAYQMLVDYSFV